MASRRKMLPDESTLPLFDDLPSVQQIRKELTFGGLRHPVWTEQKARLIERYLYFFVMITKHGTYIDGFSGPQEPSKVETWAAKLVLESRPRLLRNFHLCELDSDKVHSLRSLVSLQPPKEKKEAKRTIEIYPGDFNQQVDSILSSGKITEKEATFALLDQRTFECNWRTVQKLAEHKKQSNKIELFYFLAVKWLHRSLAGTGLPGADKVTAWWGNEGWRQLAQLSQDQIRDMVRDRFLNELGYQYAFAWPIWEQEAAGGSVMYYMIHATDHDEAPKLMWRAYNQAVAPVRPPDQFTLDLAFS